MKVNIGFILFVVAVIVWAFSIVYIMHQYSGDALYNMVFQVSLAAGVPAVIGLLSSTKHSGKLGFIVFASIGLSWALYTVYSMHYSNQLEYNAIAPKR